MEFEEAVRDGPAEEVVKPPAASEMRIHVSDLERYKHYGLASKQCQHTGRYGRAKKCISHTDACRRELMRNMAEAEEGTATMDSHTGRVDRNIAEHI